MFLFTFRIRRPTQETSLSFRSRLELRVRQVLLKGNICIYIYISIIDRHIVLRSFWQKKSQKKTKPVTVYRPAKWPAQTLSRVLSSKPSWILVPVVPPLLYPRPPNLSLGHELRTNTQIHTTPSFRAKKMELISSLGRKLCWEAGLRRLSILRKLHPIQGMHELWTEWSQINSVRISSYMGTRGILFLQLSWDPLACITYI